MEKVKLYVNKSTTHYIVYLSEKAGTIQISKAVNTLEKTIATLTNMMKDDNREIVVIYD